VQDIQAGICRSRTDGENTRGRFPSEGGG
jgi:hypothetical protein